MNRFFNRKSKDIVGIVCNIGKPGTKTIRVQTTYFIFKKKLQKQYRFTNCFLVHDEFNRCKLNDKIIFYFTDKISPLKYAVVKEIIK